jgi:alpha-tubulin suppressor-like RCC1 family protein
MKTLSFLTGLRRARCLYVGIVLALITTQALGQSETNNMITYDTVFNTGSGSATHTWTVRITRPVNMFTPNHPDTASRPVIITMPGMGEVGTDASNLRKFGPHYWLDNGWDGSVVLGNGKHYPILITILPSVMNVRPLPLRTCLNILLNSLHVKRNSVHVAGLSMGGMTWGRFLCFAESPGDETNMKMIKSFVALQGVANDLSIGYNLPGWTPFGRWAKQHGGKFFGLEGTNDGRGVYNIRNAIRDSVPGSGYFSFEVIGNGNHCCWNTMYDPGYHNWRSVSPVTSPYIGYNGMAGRDNSLGEYKDGSSIFQWMLRQGDTTLVGATQGTSNLPPVVNAGTNQQITLPVSSVTLNGTASDPDGSIAEVRWTKKSGPASFNIANATSLQTAVTGLVAGVYEFQLQATDNKGLSTTAVVTVTVKAANLPPVVDAGSNQTITLPLNVVALNGTASDPDGTIASSKWTKVSGPTTFSILNLGSLLTSVTGLVAGVYDFELAVTDNQGAVGRDTVRITVNALLINNPPTANAGNDQTITLPVSSVTLTGVASDPEGKVASTAWSKVSGPASFSIASPAQLSTAVNNLTAGQYGFEFKVTDDKGLVARDTVYVTVVAASAPPPTQQPNNTVGGSVKIGLGEYQVLFIDKTGYLYGLGNLSNIGINGSGTVGVPKRVAVTPADLKFRSATGGLHGAGAIDEYGNLWITGDNDQAQHGQGDLTANLAPRKITVDANGNPFTNIASVVAWFVQNAHNGWYAVKEDGTLWTWGRTRGGMRGNGTNTTQDETRPVQITIPGGRKVKQIVAGYFAIALCTDGTVWTWGPASNANLGYTATGNDALSPHQLTSLTNITQVAGGQNYNYALRNDGKLFGWGNYGDYMGVENGLPINTPKELTTITDVINSPITKIVTNSMATQAISADGKLWAWGNGGQGTIGNGKKMDFSISGNPFDRGNLMQKTPYNVAPTRKFVDVFGSSVYTMYTYAIGEDGQIYCWGRGKASVLANQLRAASPGITASYGNDWDIAWPTPVNPFEITQSYVITARACLLAPLGTPCNQYGIPTNTKPKANAGAEQRISGSSTELNGTVSSDNVFIGFYEWSQVDGPNTAVMDLPASKKPRISSLVTGVYTFKLKVTDNGWLSDSATVKVYVNAVPPTNQAPTANAGSNISITLPANSVTLNGSGTDADGTVTGYSWTYVSGPSQYLISSPTQAQTTVSNLTQGVYKFELTVTDDKGATGKSTVTVTVNAAIPNQLPTANSGPNRVITLPVNTTTLAGSGSDADGTIVSYQWFYVSGPATYTIVSPTQAQTVLNNLVQGTYRFALKVTDNAGGTANDTLTVTVNAAIPPPNQLPVASAGPARVITLPTNSTSLAGSGTDADGTIVSYKWSFVSGPGAYTIVSPTSAQTNVNGLQQGVYRFELMVTDNNGGVGRDTVTVTVNAAAVPNQAPIAYTGANQTITLPANSVTVNGNGSTDADGSITAYQWSFVSGPSQYTIVNPNQVQTVINNLVQGVYKFQLKVTDNKNAVGLDTIIITVNAAVIPNQAPIAYTGVNQTITLPVNSVTVNGSGSSDADGTITAYFWSYVSGPSQYTIASPAQVQTAINGLVQGVYRFQLRVTDNKGATGLDTVTITVNAAVVPNVPPVAVAGNDIIIHLPATSATVNGSGSYDSDGSIASYKWSYVSGPAQYVIASPNQAQTLLSGLVNGSYKFLLTVTDNKGATGRDTVSVIVNRPPVAVAGNDVVITLPTNSLTLSGAVSYDADGVLTSYLWKKISGPAQSVIATPNQKQTLVSNLVQGTYKFELTVGDNYGATGVDTVTVIVNADNTVNQAPTANAGTDITIQLPVNTVTLKGTGVDADGVIASYKWTKIAGPAATILTPSQAQTVVNDLTAGVYRFELVVTDNKGAIGKDTVTVTVRAAASVNQPPVANAGDKISVSFPSPVSLDASKSYDTDGQIVSYKWTLVSGPASAPAVITTPNAAQTQVTGLPPGDYVFRVVVTDNGGLTDEATVAVEVLPSESRMVIYPNPAKTYIDVEIQSSTHRNKTTLVIVNNSGMQVHAEQFMREQAKMIRRVDVSTLVPGIYHVKVQVDINNVVTKKFIKL